MDEDKPITIGSSSSSSSLSSSSSSSSSSSNNDTKKSGGTQDSQKSLVTQESKQSESTEEIAKRLKKNTAKTPEKNIQREDNSDAPKSPIDPQTTGSNSGSKGAHNSNSEPNGEAGVATKDAGQGE
jgi:hypothetical protein